ncbi:AAA family ATPase [Acetobacteraceae bacterium H6797]|nr:AAA family ATPase [Acetobacteraceae bacterium H6797]
MTRTLASAPPAAAPRGRVIAIASGKGGVGKTWFSITLAHALARAGQRTLLVDGDLGLANVDVQLGLNPLHDLSGVLTGKLPLEKAILPQPGGFGILPGRSGSGALASLDGHALDHVAALMPRAAQGRDAVVLDLGAGLDAAVRRLAASADTLLIVATEEPTSLTDAYAALKLHDRDRPGGDARIVVNQAQDINSGRRTYEALARAASVFLKRDVPLAGIIRRDPKVRDAIRHQTPLLTRHPHCQAAADVELIANGL